MSLLEREICSMMTSVAVTTNKYYNKTWHDCKFLSAGSVYGMIVPVTLLLTGCLYDLTSEFEILKYPAQERSRSTNVWG